MSAQDIYTWVAGGASIGNVAKAFIVEGSAVTLLGRVSVAGGGVAVQSDISAIAVEVWDKTLATMVQQVTPEVTDVISNALLTDSRWTADATGYNLTLLLPGICFPAGDRVYRVEVKITMIDGNVIFVLWDLQATGVYSQ